MTAGCVQKPGNASATVSYWSITSEEWESASLRSHPARKDLERKYAPLLVEVIEIIGGSYTVVQEEDWRHKRPLLSSFLKVFSSLITDFFAHTNLGGGLCILHLTPHQTQTPCGFLAVGTAFSKALGLPIILRAVPPPFFEGPATFFKISIIYLNKYDSAVRIRGLLMACPGQKKEGLLNKLSDCIAEFGSNAFFQIGAQ